MNTISDSSSPEEILSFIEKDVSELRRGNQRARIWVSDTLVKIGTYAAPALIETLNTQDEKLRARGI